MTVDTCTYVPVVVYYTHWLLYVCTVVKLVVHVAQYMYVFRELDAKLKECFDELLIFFLFSV